MKPARRRSWDTGGNIVMVLGNVLFITGIFNSRIKMVDLTLSGHTHGGQIGFTVSGVNINLAYAVFRYPRGFYKEDNSQLYVNAGIGTIGLPIRTIPPEITLFTLFRET